MDDALAWGLVRRTSLLRNRQKLQEVACISIYKLSLSVAPRVALAFQHDEPYRTSDLWIAEFPLESRGSHS